MSEGEPQGRSQVGSEIGSPLRDEGTLLEVDSLSVEYSTDSGPLKAVRDVSFDLEEGETFGVAGESGSGKSTLTLAILRYLGDNGSVTGGHIRFRDQSLLDLSERELRNLRGNRIAHCAQHPDKALNPSIRVGEQIAETIQFHEDVSQEEATRQTVKMLEDVNIPDPEYNADRYPHELSGGMQQRVLIAMALACDPDLLILDEPTTGLDVTTEAKIIDLVEELKQEYHTSILLITHDLGVIAQVADRVGIMYAGEFLEVGPVGDVFHNPTNPYTQGLLEAIPRIGDSGDLEAIPGQLPDLTDVPEGCIFADRCEFAEPACRSGPIEEESVSGDMTHRTRCRRWETAVEEWDGRHSDAAELSAQDSSTATLGDAVLEADSVRKYFGSESFFDRLLGGDPPVRAVDGVDFEVHESETLGLVGESGCGKSTLAETVLRLLDLTDGRISFRGNDIASLDGADLKEFRSEAQIVFQHPDSSLNPRKKVRSVLNRPLELFTDMDADERDDRIGELLAQVDLGPAYASRYPHELSGGEKQRVAIARAFAVNPAFVVLDEPLSALDVSIQASILNLLSSLRKEYGASCLFISHDLSVVNHISDRIAVMYLGQIAEIGSKTAVFEPPYHPYTQALLSSVPSPDPDDDGERIHLSGDVPSARNPPSGCRFHTRCPKKIGAVCEEEEPTLEPVESSSDSTHHIACHLDEDEMAAPVENTDQEVDR